MRREETPTTDLGMAFVREIQHSSRTDRKVIITLLGIILVVVLFTVYFAWQSNVRADRASKRSNTNAQTIANQSQIIKDETATIKALGAQEQRQITFEDQVRRLLLCNTNTACLQDVLKQLQQQQDEDARAAANPDTTVPAPAKSSTTTTTTTTFLATSRSGPSTPPQSTTTTTSRPPTTTTSTIRPLPLPSPLPTLPCAMVPPLGTVCF